MKQYLLAGASVLALTRVASAGPVTFDYTGAVVDYTVPATGLYQIVAAGAQGGADGNGVSGGNGAVISGKFSLTAGDELVIAVGGQGGNGQAFRSYAGAGGGGSFAVDQTTSTKLVIAGGGGGGYENNGGPGITGHGGGGGGGSSFSLGAGGGGGYRGNGGGAEASGGRGFPNLAGGATYWGGGANGGFGGGGASGANGAGGGGGYTGGNAGGDYGFGGGSYDSGMDPTLVAGAQAGDGYVTLTRESVPEPAAIGLFGMALAGLGASRRRVRR
ncbi:MAG TPA: PEP-CTERM sorting domain-containing protein [Acetobacteraceae bacterium]